MGVIRVEHNKNYTTMSNYHLRDENLSLKAVGLMSWMLSLPENWNFTTEGIVKCRKEGKDAIRGALKELEEAGYLVIKTGKDESSRFSVEYTLYEKPRKKTDEPQRKSRSGKTVTENPPQINTNEKSTNKGKNQKSKISGEQAPLVEKSLTKQEKIARIYGDPANKNIIEPLRKFQAWFTDNHYGYNTSSLAEWATSLREIAGDDIEKAFAVVDQSIEHDWRGLYPLKRGKVEKTVARSIPVKAEDKAKNPDGSFVIF